MPIMPKQALGESGGIVRIFRLHLIAAPLKRHRLRHSHILRPRSFGGRRWHMRRHSGRPQSESNDHLWQIMRAVMNRQWLNLPSPTSPTITQAKEKGPRISPQPPILVSQLA
jgi:hypothetical protein